MTVVAALAGEQPAPAPATRFVLPGHLAVGRGAARITTVLGSCVSICLFDPSRQAAGINHFLFSGHPSRPEPAVHRWAEPASEALLERMVALGVPSKSLQAKVFGGAQMNVQSVPAHLRIGERNVQSAFAWLKSKGIPFVGGSVGGNLGRKIVLDCATGEVWMRELARE